MLFGLTCNARRRWTATAMCLLLGVALTLVVPAVALAVPKVVLSAVAFARGETFCVTVATSFVPLEGEATIRTEGSYLRLPVRDVTYCMVAPSGEVLFCTKAGRVYSVSSAQDSHVTLHLTHSVASYTETLGDVLSFDYDGTSWLFEYYHNMLLQSLDGSHVIPIVRSGGGAPLLLLDDCGRHNGMTPTYNAILRPKIYRQMDAMFRSSRIKVVCSAESGLYEIENDGTYNLIYDYWRGVTDSTKYPGFRQAYDIPSCLAGDQLYLIGGTETAGVPERDCLLVVNLRTSTCRVLPLKIMDSSVLLFSVRRDVLTVWYVFFPAWRGRVVDFDLKTLSLRSCFPRSFLETPPPLKDATVTYE